LDFLPFLAFGYYYYYYYYSAGGNAKFYAIGICYGFKGKFGRLG
jgi:hypothetical protein